ncbi:uncharacterized protein EAE97_012004 [Botrytis byssoidea]|uniref:Carboxylic ester hydrolase n=1 Tax=Botrytis byssoidea TaxID=139641 RepID=A0A9P5HR79_9HELO|nr:uncharacterized protein EAE97_012004 [Botrytis byssoidea]KAF7917866.1 hypothetical protein EAE97_012004 [Botrytis byssoidea]
MRSTLLILGLLAKFAVAYDCSVTAIAALLPVKSIVFYATHYDAGATFTPPPEYNAGGGLPGGGLPGGGPGGPPGAPPGGGGSIIPQAGCIVQGNVSLSATSQYSFGLALPDNWNGRFLTVENGGFSGSVSWGSVVSFFYYRGCSAGGKQGLKEVEMFPNDFDGVVAGAPAWWTTHLQLWNMIVGIWNQPANSSHYIPPSMSTYLADEVIRECNAQDSVTDGIVMDPIACKFNATKNLCRAGATDPTTCLNSDQIATFNKLHSDWVEAGQFIFPSFTLGSEWGWNGLVSFPSPLGTTYVQYMLGLGPDWTWEDWNPAIILLSDLLNPGHATADNFNLAPFYKKGGKLLHYHGLSDASIANGSSIYFYNQVAKALKPQGIKLDDLYKFYLIPGIGHCAMT